MSYLPKIFTEEQAIKELGFFDRLRWRSDRKFIPLRSREGDIEGVMHGAIGMFLDGYHGLIVRCESCGKPTPIYPRIRGWADGGSTSCYWCKKSCGAPVYCPNDGTMLGDSKTSLVEAGNMWTLLSCGKCQKNWTTRELWENRHRANEWLEWEFNVCPNCEKFYNRLSTPHIEYKSHTYCAKTQATRNYALDS